MEFMQSPSSSGTHGIKVDDCIRGSDESINGNWHSSSSPSAATLKSSHTPNHANPMQNTTKGKEKEMVDSLQKTTPRRMAASKAMDRVMKKSTSTAIKTSPAKESNLAEASTSTQASSSPSSPLQKLPFIRGIAGQQRSKSSSPLPPIRSNGDLEYHPSISTSTAAITTLPPAEKSPLESAELEQFHFQAASDSKTNLLPRLPPNLPYDASYLPLSPNGIDQVGHILAPVASNSSEKQSGAVKGLGENTKQGKGQASFNKKILPGQELEEHVVSQVSGHQAMPWGLKATLLEKQLGGERAKTKMGSLKRNARRDNRRGKVQGAGKIEDDPVSDIDSPQVPSIEISEAIASMPAVLDLDEEQEQENERNEGQEDVESTLMQDQDQQNGQDIVAPLQGSNDSQGKVISHSDPVQEDAPPKTMKAKRPRKPQLDVSPNWSAIIVDEPPVSESCSQKGGMSESNTKRPREAHKRLKIVGGYYSKLSLHREANQVESDVKKTNGQQTGANGSASRGTSTAPDDGTQNHAEDTVMTSSIDQPTLSSPIPLNKQANNTLRRMPATHGSPSKLIHASGEVINADTSDAGNNEYCETCRGSGHFICCDGCPRSFHFACIDPPLDIDELPNSIGDETDTWFCNVCRTARQGDKRKQKSGLFGPLIRLTQEENPTIFALPPDIRNYFKGVATANDGSYVNSTMLRPIKVNKLGVVEEREPLRLQERNGKPILCFQCGESAMPVVSNTLQSPYRWKDRPSRRAAEIANAAVTSQSIHGNSADLEAKKGWRKIISCDFCNLHWHLDCLDPPMATMPSLARKWMCPNHIEHVMPSERIPKNVANNTSVHELPIPSKETVGPGKHYRMRVVNDGQIDIIPDPMDTYTGPAHDVPGLLAGSSSSSTTNSGIGKSSGSGDKGWEEVTATFPAYKGYPTVFGTHNNVKLKYKLPEKVIRLDFWSKAELQREKLAEATLRDQEKSRKDGLDLLAIVANAALIEEDSISLDNPPKLNRAITNNIVETIFSSKKQEDHPYVKPGEEPVSLLRQSYIAGEYEREFEGLSDEPANQNKAITTATNMRNKSHGQDQPDEPTGLAQMDQNEVVKLKAIQKLIAYKGKDALLRFLLD